MNDKKSLGSSGVILLYKIAGALAEKKAQLNEIMDFCQQISDNIVTHQFITKTNLKALMGLCPCSTPKACNKTKVTTEEALRKIAREYSEMDMLEKIQPDSTPLVILVNSLCGNSRMEELLFTKELLKSFYSVNASILRIYSARYLCSLKDTGYTVTVLRVTNPKVLPLLDHPTEAQSWVNYCIEDLKKDLNYKIPLALKQQIKFARQKGPKLHNNGSNVVLSVVNLACLALISCEKQLNTIDMESGGGNFGSSLKKGAEVIMSVIAVENIKCWPYALLVELSRVVETSIGGTAGTLYSIFFESAAQVFRDMKDNDVVTANIWAEALSSGVASLKKYV